jgi:hypothetical protein
MALAKLFKVMDVNGQYWHVPAPSFSEAIKAMERWESGDPPEDGEESVQSLQTVEDLILGGTREDSLGNYEDIGYAPSPSPARDYTLENNMAFAAEALLKNLPPNEVSPNLTAEFWKAVDELRSAIDKYQEVPF